MPIPPALAAMGISAYHTADISLPLTNPKAATASRITLSRVFRVYLEVAMQAKHDANMRSYCDGMGIAKRNRDGSQVSNSGATGAAALQTFYRTKSTIAATIARDGMQTKWGAQGANGAPVFTPGTRVDASVQRMLQTDGFRYEVSYWYDVQDIYVLYHCYPA